MSRSLSIPLRLLSSPQIGIEPTSSSANFLAASSTVSFSPTHSTPPVVASRAVFATFTPSIPLFAAERASETAELALVFPAPELPHSA
jgi:hypothetical protein